MRIAKKLNIMPNNNNLTFQSWNINKTDNFPYYYFGNIIANTDSYDFDLMLKIAVNNLGNFVTGEEIIKHFIKQNVTFKKTLKIIDASYHANYFSWHLILKKTPSKIHYFIQFSNKL